MYLDKLGEFSLQSLRYFSVVASKGSIAETARLLGMSQPAVTLQIQNLEKQLGFSLFERKGRRIVLTSRGRAMFQKVLPELERLEGILVDAKSEETARPKLFISTVQGVGEYWLSNMLTSFLSVHRENRLYLEFEEPAELEDRLLTGQTALILSPRKVDDPRVVSEPLRKEKIIPVGSEFLIADLESKMRSSKKGARFWEDFDWIGYGTTTESDPWAQQWLEDAGVFIDRRFRYTHVVNSFEVIKRMLLEGAGISVIPEHTCEVELQNGTLQKIENKKWPAIINTLYICYRQDSLNQAQREFRDWLKKSQ